MFPHPYIAAELCGREPVSERPLEDPDSLFFDLREGTSLDEAQQIANFLNKHLPYVAINRFGDAEDAARDVKQSERIQTIELDRFSVVITMLKEKLAAHDFPAALEAANAVVSVIGDLIRDWSKAIAMSREILDKFGERGDHDA